MQFVTYLSRLSHMALCLLICKLHGLLLSKRELEMLLTSQALDLCSTLSMIACCSTDSTHSWPGQVLIQISSALKLSRHMPEQGSGLTSVSHSAAQLASRLAG